MIYNKIIKNKCSVCAEPANIAGGKIIDGISSLSLTCSSGHTFWSVGNGRMD